MSYVLCVMQESVLRL